MIHLKEYLNVRVYDLYDVNNVYALTLKDGAIPVSILVLAIEKEYEAW